MTITAADSKNEISLAFDELSRKKNLWYDFIFHPSAAVGLAFIATILIMALLGPLLSGYSYEDIHLEIKNQPPTAQHWFGTDDLGRDVFTRVWYGARISLTIGIAAACIDIFIGIFWGSLAAYFGGWLEDWMMNVADILYSLPYLLVVIVLSLILGTGFISILAALTILGWITMARIVRGQVRYLKQLGYIQASIAFGARYPHVLIKHLIPNMKGPIIVTLTNTIPAAIFAEAFLSFMGLGIQAPMSSWGTMAHEGLSAFSFYPWRLFFPAAAISLTMLGFNLIGDVLSSFFDHREVHV